MKKLILRAYPVVVVLVDTLLLYELGKGLVSDIKKYYKEKKSKSPAKEPVADETTN